VRHVDLTLTDLRHGAAPPTPLAGLAAGLLFGAGLGAFELALLVDLEQPSVGRRATGLLLYAAVQSGVLCGLLFALAAFWTGVGHRRGWRTALGAGRPCYVGSLAGLGVLVALVLAFGEGRGLEPHEVRLAWTGGIVLASLCAGFLVARVLHGRPATARTLASLLRVPAATLSFLVLGGISFYVVDPAGFRSEQARSSPVPAPSDAPDVLLVVVDTLRADVIGAYGADGAGGTASTPVMDRLASEGVLFEQAIAPSSWTLPSVASLFTSRLPADHGFVTFDGVLPHELAGLPATLAEAGYACRAVVANQLMNPERGFARGFEVYDVYGYECEGDLAVSRLFDRLLLLCGPRRSFGPAKRPFLRLVDRFPFVGTAMTHYVYDEDVNERVFAHALTETDRPLFLYVHYLAPHSPYLEHPLAFLPGQPAFRPENVDTLRRNYLSEVSYTDALLGELLAGLKKRGFLEESIVVVTSDHGEEFREHGKWLHGNGLYQEVVRVPLLVRAPGIESGTRVAEPVSLIDVAPTILALAGVEVPATFEGRDLLAPDAAPRPVVTELLPKTDGIPYSFYGVLAGNRKVISRRALDGGEELLEVFDLASDAREEAPLPATVDPAAAAVGADPLAPLLELLAERAAREVQSASQGLSGAELERLKALGYVDE
jgi:arylsulfatase A-like enzyme